MPRRSQGPPPQRWLAVAERLDETNGWKTNNPFGKASNPPWKQPQNDEERAAIAAAKHQHRLAMEIHLRMVRAEKSTKELAEQMNISAGTLRKILAGSAHVNLTDLHRIAIALDTNFVGRYRDPRPETGQR